MKSNGSLSYLDWIIRLGLALLALALISLLVIYYPLIINEVKYQFVPKSKHAIIVTDPGVISSEFLNADSRKIVAEDPDFSIIIPKIDANSKVIKDVDPYDSKIYQVSLTKGVAHAKGTALPGQYGNSFYFAHSSDNPYNATRFNSIFYLLKKLEKDDEFYLVYKDVIYQYKVVENSVVSADSIDYMTQDLTKKTATLMTCWPPGTTLKRLVVVGDFVDIVKQ